MSKRYGRNQKRQAREKITELEATAYHLRRLADRAMDLAKPIDAKRALLDNLAARLGPDMLPYIQRMIDSDQRSKAARGVLSLSTHVDMATGYTIMHAHFELHAGIRLEP